MQKLLIVFLLLGFASVSRADCLRCGNDVVCPGESRFDVMNKCGPPDYSEETSRSIPRTGMRYDDSYVQERVENLYYNCGDGRFVRILTIRNGKIDSIANGQRGSGSVKCD